MSNDPDLLDEECRECHGTGWGCRCDPNDLDAICNCPFDTYYDCLMCGGDGRVLRG